MKSREYYKAFEILDDLETSARTILIGLAVLQRHCEIAERTDGVYGSNHSEVQFAFYTAARLLVQLSEAVREIDYRVYEHCKERQEKRAKGNPQSP